MAVKTNAMRIIESAGINFQAFEYDISEISGIHNLYFTYDTGDSSLNINWFELS